MIIGEAERVQNKLLHLQSIVQKLEENKHVSHKEVEELLFGQHDWIDRTVKLLKQNYFKSSDGV